MLLDGFGNKTGVKPVERTVKEGCDISRHFFSFLQAWLDLLRHRGCVWQIVVVSDLGTTTQLITQLYTTQSKQYN